MKFNDMLSSAVDNARRAHGESMKPSESALATMRKLGEYVDLFVEDIDSGLKTTSLNVHIADNGAVVVEIETIMMSTVKMHLLCMICQPAEGLVFEAPDDYHVRMTIIYPSVF